METLPSLAVLTAAGGLLLPQPYGEVAATIVLLAVVLAQLMLMGSLAAGGAALLVILLLLAHSGRGLAIDGPIALAIAAQLALFNRSIALRLRSSDKLRKALRRNSMWETRFAEAQHRLGNNLGIVSGALNLQARRAADPATRRALREAADRIVRVGEVNSVLNQTPAAPVRIDTAFVQALAQKCLKASGAEARVEAIVSVTTLDISPDQFLPLTLILGECVNNSLEHGFPDERPGEIRIGLQLDGGGEARLTVEDNGIGPPPGFDAERATSTGLVLVHAFARQLGGRFRLMGGAGARAVLDFPLASVMRVV